MCDTEEKQPEIKAAEDSECGQQSESDVNPVITLQVGDQRFTTHESTLTNDSGYLKAVLSGRWGIPKLPDGAIFVDADPGLFEIILNYLRRGVFPVFHDLQNGHNHRRYHQLLEEARYFQIPKLVKWLEKKVYLRAITVEHQASVTESPMELMNLTSEVGQWSFYPTWETRKVYLCPRRIFVHRGSRGSCGRQCEAARVGAELEYEDEKYLTTVLIRKRVIVDETLCKDGWDKDEE